VTAAAALPACGATWRWAASSTSSPASPTGRAPRPT
jgi:hypothetical protein